MSEAPDLATRHGVGRVIISVYGIFALAACSRAGVQIATKFSQAPMAYLLSALAGLIYIAATVFLIRGGRRAHRWATVACGVELAGVLGVGALSLVSPQDFPDATVWSGFGAGYGFVPLVLPVLGLWWLRRTSRTASATTPSTAA